MSIIIVGQKKAALEERGKEKMMAQKTASPYQTNGLTFRQIFNRKKKNGNIAKEYIFTVDYDCKI